MRRHSYYRTFDAVAEYRSDSVDADFIATIRDGNAPDEAPGRDISGIELTALAILGVDLDPVTDFDALPVKLQEAVMALADEVEWKEE